MKARRGVLFLILVAVAAMAGAQLWAARNEGEAKAREWGRMGIREACFPGAEAVFQEAATGNVAELQLSVPGPEGRDRRYVLRGDQRIQGLVSRATFGRVWKGVPVGRLKLVYREKPQSGAAVEIRIDPALAFRSKPGWKRSP